MRHIELITTLGCLNYVLITPNHDIYLVIVFKLTAINPSTVHIFLDPDALGEYTGVKPDEFLTMTKDAMMNTGQIMYDTMQSGMTTMRRNSCSTLSRDSGLHSYPSVERGIGGGYVGPMDYDTGECAQYMCIGGGYVGPTSYDTGE